jgi:hypothetical protein
MEKRKISFPYQRKNYPNENTMKKGRKKKIKEIPVWRQVKIPPA